LKGNLKQIKKSFPKEKIILHTESPVKGLQDIKGVAHVNQTESGYDMRITDATAAQHVLRSAMEQSIVNRFELMEPTLNEIFIKSVGGEIHE